MHNKYFNGVKYLTINDNDLKWGLTTTTVGFQSIKPSQDYPTKEHPSPYYYYPDYGRILQEFQLIYVTKGKGSFKSAQSDATAIEEGSIIFLFPDEWHTYRPSAKEGWDAYWIGFKGLIAGNLLDKQFLQKRAPIQNIGHNEQMVNLFQQALDIASREQTSFQPLLSGITMHLLGLIHYTVKNDAVKDKEIIHKINKARLLMQEYPFGDNRLESIAAALNMSYSWFRKLFKQYTGITPAQYQMNIKVEKAKNMLIATSMPIKEIAFTLAFESTNYFSIFFKNKTGKTPLSFRNLNRRQLNQTF